MPPAVNIVDPASGRTYSVDEAEAARLEADGWKREGAAQKVNRLVKERQEDEYGGVVGAVTAAGAAGLGTVSGGLSDAVFRGLGVEDEFRGVAEVNPGASTFGTAAGAFVPFGAPGLAMRAGKAAGTVAEGAGIGAKILGGVKAGVTEGAIMGVGSGISEVSLSKEPLTLERAVSSIGSHALFGGAVGGAAGGLLKAGGIGLRAAQSKLDDVAAKAAAGQVDDATKIALRDEVAAFRKELKQKQPWIAAKDSGVPGLQTVGKRSFKADKALDNLLDDPKALVDNPKAALRHLRVQESALQEVAAKTDEIRAALTAQKSTRRLAALDAVAPTLERNRALQEKIGAIIAKPAEATSGGLAGNMLGGTAFSAAAGVVGAIPGVGPLLAPFAGSAASKLVTEGLGKMAAKQAARTSKAIGAVLDVTGKMPNVAPVLASKVFSSVKFSEGKAPKLKEPKKGKAAPQIAGPYKRVTDDIKQQTMFGPDGKAMMRPEAREKMAQSFDAVRMVDPIAADKLETMAARRVTALSDRIPRKPDVFGHQMGPNTWQPSDMEMRAYARFVAAVEDPIGVIERLATGQVTTEDRDAMKTVYPEMYADVQAQIMSQLPMLQKQLPYHRRLALSIFSEIPVDPALDPVVLGVLQAQYVEEPETEGGTQAPIAKPQFGSVKAEQPTAAQSREQGA